MRMILFISILSIALSGCGGLFGSKKRDKNLTSVQTQLDTLLKERANRNVTVDDLRTEIQLLAGEIDTTRHDFDERTTSVVDSLEKIEKRLAAIESNLGSGDGRGKFAWATLWENAEKSFDKKKYAKATTQYRSIIKKYPKAPIAGKAQFKLAETLFKRKLYADSILVYEELKKKYPSSPDHPRAYLQQARAFTKLGKKKEAKLFYKKLKELYPKSKEAKIGSAELKKLS